MRDIGRSGLNEHVHLIGALYGEGKYATLRSASCFCLPSRQEGFSIAILEAMACRLPVVISEACHFPEVAQCGAGRVVRLEPAEIATALREVLQDRDAARPLIKALVSMCGRLQISWADGGYLGALVNWVKQLRPFGKLRLEIVRRCDDVKGFKVLPRRWVVERTFGCLFKSRRLCRDYEVRLDHSAAMIRICMIRIMIRRLAAT